MLALIQITQLINLNSCCCLCRQSDPNTMGRSTGGQLVGPTQTSKLGGRISRVKTNSGSEMKVSTQIVIGDVVHTIHKVPGPTKP